MLIKRSLGNPGFFKGKSGMSIFTKIKIDKDMTHEIQEESLEERIKRLEKAIEHKEAELIRSRQLSMLGVMASGLAHEITQPLQIILAVSQNCQRDIKHNTIDSNRILDDLKYIAANTKRIDHIVNHLHVLSRESKPKLEKVAINAIIEDSLIMFQQQLKSRGIKVEKKLADNLPFIKADKIQLEQVFVNLINNSRDALTGCQNKQIMISTETYNGEIQIKFEDTGEGIPSGKLPFIFDAFMTTKEKGVGLGLYITQDIIYSYGGRITVQSKVNEGTAFLIKLPIAKEEENE